MGLYDCKFTIEHVFQAETAVQNCTCGTPETYNEYLLLACLDWYLKRVEHDKDGDKNFYEQIARCIIKYFVNSYLDESQCTYVHNYIFQERNHLPSADDVWKVYCEILKKVPEKAIKNKKPVKVGVLRFLTRENSIDSYLLNRSLNVSLSDVWEGEGNTKIYITMEIDPLILHKEEDLKKMKEKVKEMKKLEEEQYKKIKELTEKVNDNKKEWLDQVVDLQKKIKELIEKVNHKDKEEKEWLDQVVDLQKKNKELNDKVRFYQGLTYKEFAGYVYDDRYSEERWTPMDVVNLEAYWKDQVRELEETCDKKDKQIKELNDKLNDKDKKIEEIIKDKKEEIQERINKILELINN